MVIAPSRSCFAVSQCRAPASGTASVRAGDEFPYEAYITRDDVYVRSGPGKNYYPTDKLSTGATVEVYRHDPGGWCAVRPPAGSFSWVAGEYLKPLDEPYAEVVGERVVARVGTSLGDTRDVIQVRLDRGEEVEVLEAKRFGTGPAAQTWYKIAPPAGEFRWIHGEFLDRQPPQKPTPRKDHSGNLLVQQIERANPPGESVQYDGESAIDDRSNDIRLVDHREPLDGDLEAAARLATRSGDTRHPGQHSASRPATRRVPTNSHTLLTLDEELKAIDFELSVLVVQDPATWNFSQLRSRTNDCLAQAATALDRGRARLILKKIDRFESIRQQDRELATSTPRVEERARSSISPTAQSSTSASASRSARVRPSTVDPRFDGTGRLTQVDSGRPNAPNYALTDANGQVRYYVSPAPGINLRHYIGREVGLSGSVGYTPEFDSQHVTARRVTVLDGRILR